MGLLKTFQGLSVNWNLELELELAQQQQQQQQQHSVAQRAWQAHASNYSGVK